MDRDLAQFVEDTFFVNTNTLMQCVIASWTSGLLVLLAMAIGLLLGWSKMEKKTPKDTTDPKQSNSPKKGTKKKKRKKKTKSNEFETDSEFETKSKPNQSADTDAMTSFLCAAGDELMMRCILLPELLAIYGDGSFFEIASICGMVSALQNMLYVFASKETFKMTDITSMILIESASGSIYLRTFFMCWLGWISSYSWFVATAGHFTFLRINEKYLGPNGMCKGNLWLINADGLAGCIAAGVYVGIIYLWMNIPT